MKDGCLHKSAALAALIGATNAAAATAATASTAATATTAAGPSPGGMLQVTIGLLIVVAVLFVVAWSMKKIGAGRQAVPGAIKVVGGISVGNRERILVIEVADQWIVVGVTPTSITSLSTLPRQEGVAAMPHAVLPKSFPAWLKQTIDQRQAASQRPSSGSEHAG